MFVFGSTVKTWPFGLKFAFIPEIYICCDYFFCHKYLNSGYFQIDLKTFTI